MAIFLLDGVFLCFVTDRMTGDCLDDAKTRQILI